MYKEVVVIMSCDIVNFWISFLFSKTSISQFNPASNREAWA